MLSWLYGTTQDPVMTTQTTTCAPLEKTRGAGFKGTWQRKQQSTHTHTLPSAVANAIHPTFEALSDQDLLRRCLHGGTQNRNEAINALIWQRATKETHSGLPTVELAANLAVPHFNDGSVSLKLVLKELGITPGSHCSQACKKLDYDRWRHARRKSSDQSKERRKQIRNWKKGYSDHLEAIEGLQYEAGAF